MEDLKGIPLVGPTGMEFDGLYLPLAGLNRTEVYTSNARHCRPDLNRKPTLAETLDCASTHLPGELESVKPEIVILMGATACSLIQDIDLETEHGIPRWCDDLYGWLGMVVPMYHPALGLHETSAMTMMIEDWTGLREWLESGLWTWPVDSLCRRWYSLATSVEDIYEYFDDTRNPEANNK